jgi:hypothetical protein
MQYATDIRKSVEPLLTCAQKKSLEDIIRLQQDALQKMGSGSLADFLQAFFERAQAGAESAGLRNSIESGWQNKQPSPPWYAHPLALR